MLLIDANNMFFSVALDSFMNDRGNMTKDAVRSVLIGRLKRVMDDMKSVPGDTILAFDSRHYWRKDVFPYYKASRAKTRESQNFDWERFFPIFNDIREEIRENFPVKVLMVDGAEADDVIAVLAMRYGNAEPVTIWSSDTDDLQLQLLNPKIKQYSLVKKKNITPESENYSLFEHIVRGDSGDGIPNILTPVDHFVNRKDGARQKSVTKNNLENWRLNQHDLGKVFTESMMKRFEENRQLIDFQRIPQYVVDAIDRSYHTESPSKGRMFSYLVKHGLTNIMKA